MVVFIPGGQVIGGGLLTLGEGFVILGTGVTVADDFRKGKFRRGVLNLGLSYTGFKVGQKLTNARSLGFKIPYKQQEEHIILGFNNTFFNISSYGIDKGVDKIEK